MDRTALLSTLRSLLREALNARFAGGSHAKLTQLTSYADGFMRALLDSGLADRAELLAVVAEERTRFVGGEKVADRSAA